MNTGVVQAQSSRAHARNSVAETARKKAGGTEAGAAPYRLGHMHTATHRGSVGEISTNSYRGKPMCTTGDRVACARPLYDLSLTPSPQYTAEDDIDTLGARLSGNKSSAIIDQGADPEKSREASEKLTVRSNTQTRPGDRKAAQVPLSAPAVGGRPGKEKSKPKDPTLHLLEEGSDKDTMGATGRVESHPAVNFAGPIERARRDKIAKKFVPSRASHSDVESFSLCLAISISENRRKICISYDQRLGAGKGPLGDMYSVSILGANARKSVPGAVIRDENKIFDPGGGAGGARITERAATEVRREE